MVPWVKKPLAAKKSTKVGREVFRGSFEEFCARVKLGMRGEDGMKIEKSKEELVRLRRRAFVGRNCIDVAPVASRPVSESVF